MTIFESDQDSIKFRFTISPNFALSADKKVFIRIDGQGWSSDECSLNIVEGNYNTGHIFETTCNPAKLDKSKEYKWYPEFEQSVSNVISDIKPTFKFRQKPKTPIEISCESSSTPTVTWKSSVDASESEAETTPSTYRIWAHNTGTSSVVLLGTTAFNKDTKVYTFKTPIENQLSAGTWDCIVEAVKGDSSLSSPANPVTFTVPEVQDNGDIEFDLSGISETFSEKTPSITIKVTNWNEVGAPSGANRRLVVIYGPGRVAGSVNDKRKEVNMVSNDDTFEFTFDELESQTYHWRVLGKNKHGKITYSDVKTFTVTAQTNPSKVTVIEPKKEATVPYFNNTTPEIVLKWEGRSWGTYSADNDSSLNYIVTCNGGDANCTIDSPEGKTKNPYVTVKINNPSDNAPISWTVKATNGNTESEEVASSFKLCERPSSLPVPFFNKTLSGEISAPELEIGYTPLKSCDGETEDKIRVTFTPTGNTNEELRVYEVSPDTNIFKAPESLPSGSWSVSLTAFAPGYAPAVSAKNMSFTSCRGGPLPRPNITKFVSDINDKNVYINFTLATWPKDSKYCVSSNTLSEIVIQTAYNNTVTQDTLSINDTCTHTEGANGVVTYECYHNFVYDVLGTTYISLVAKNPAGDGAYSDPYPAAMRYYTDLEGSTSVTLFKPEDNACISKSEAVLTWDPLSLGIISKDSELDGIEYTVHFGANDNFSVTHNTKMSSFDVSDKVSIGGYYSWYVVPKVNNDEPYTVRTFSICGDSNPVISDVDWPSTAVLPFTISWNTAWNDGCGKKSHLVRVGGNVVGVVGEESSFTFQKDAVMFEDGKSAEISVVARQGDLISNVITKEIAIHHTLNPPKLSEPKDGDVVNATTDWVFSWEAAAIASGDVTYNLYLESAAQKFLITDIAGSEHSLDLKGVDSGLYHWSVSAVVYGKESQLAPFRSLTINVNEASAKDIALLWPPNDASAPENTLIEFSWENSRFADFDAETDADTYFLDIYGDGDLTFEVPPCQTSMSVALKAGEYKWTVSKINGDAVVNATEQFTINVVKSAKPSVPAKNPDVCCVYTQELKWEGLTNAEWGGVQCNDANESHIPERACSYMVYVGRKQDEMHFVGRTRDTNFTLQKEVAIRGTYYWTIVADNGFTTSYNESMSNTSTFKACTLMAPMDVYPIIDHGTGGYMPLELKVNFVALNQTDDECESQVCTNSSSEKDTYFFNMVYTYGSGNFSANFTEFDVDPETGYSYKVFNVNRGTSPCELSVTNKYGLSSNPADSGGSLSLCDSIPTVAPVLNDPKLVDETFRISTALVDDGKRGKKLTWHHYKDEHFGNVCPVVTITMLRLYFWTDTHPKASRVIDTKTEDFILVPFKDMLEKLGVERFEKNTTIYFQLNATNSNTYSAVSDVVELRTVNKDCTDITCDKGACDEEAIVCVCYEGYTGVDCSEEIKKGGISDGLKYGLIALGIFLFFVIVAIIIIAVHYYSKHKKGTLRPPPNFEELRTPPIRRPNYIQNLNGSPDEKLMEKVLLDENSFPLVWAIFRAAGVTEADRLSKALLYFYQKQGRGLEFILFLVSREISETTDASVLFRANSPATRAFKFYSKMIGLPYLFKTFAVMLQSIIRDINDAEEDLKEQKKLDEENSAGITLGEIDPENIDSRVGDENINVLTLQLLCQKFLLQIVRSDKNCPGELKHVCAFIKSQLENKFPQAINKGVGAFIFLRFYNTAITVPESYGLMESKKKT